MRDILLVESLALLASRYEGAREEAIDLVSACSSAPVTETDREEEFEELRAIVED